MNYDKWKTTEPEKSSLCKNCSGIKHTTSPFCSKDCEKEYYS